MVGLFRLREIPRTERSGFRLRAPAALTPAKRLKLSPAGPIVLHAKVCGSPSTSLRARSGRRRLSREIWMAFSFGLECGECGAGALAREKRASKFKLRVHPQPAIILRLLNQSRFHRILSNIFRFLLQTLIRSQHMIERFFFPDRARGVEKLINAMSRGAFQTLHDVDEREGPAVFIPRRQEQQMDVIWHDYGCVQMNSRLRAFRGRGRPRHSSYAMLPQTMFEHEIASLPRQDQTSTST